jgi:3-methyladenine DNA glycosylase AlkD
MNDVLSTVKTRLAAVSTVPALQHSVKRHCENLEALTKTLRSIGMDDQEINRNVLAVFEEYERELLRTVNQMMKGAA